MPLVFDCDIRISFDTVTNDAVLWAEDDGGRFRLVIPRTALRDRFGYAGTQLDDAAAERFIRQNWSQFETLAQEARNGGHSELVL